jgi:F-type H+-transporting ATPase subunit b
LEGLGINGTFLLSQIVNFLILFAALYFLLWKRVLAAIDARRQRVQEELDRAEQTKEELAIAQSAYAEKVAEGEAEAERIVAEAREAAGEERNEALAAGKAQVEGELADMRAQMELEREGMLRDLRGQVGALAIAAAQKIIGETMDERRQAALVQQFFSGIKAGKVAVLADAELAGEAAVVTSALPLDAAEQATYKSTLEELLGEGAEVAFRSDPSLLGGVVVQVGDQLLDDSVAGKLDDLKTQLVAS